MTNYAESAGRCKEIDFHCDHVGGYYLEDVRNLALTSSSIAINVASVPAIIERDPVKAIAPQQSKILQNTTIASAANLITVEVKERENLGSVIFQPGWQSAQELFGEKLKSVPLWRSPLQQIGEIELNPYDMTGNKYENGIKVRYSIKVNLWFATERTDCAIHNQHDFIEFHTQIIGTGRMQKFMSQTKETLFEDQILAEGNTHDIFCEAVEDRQYRYPWHQYYADSDSIWLVVELHPV